MALVLPLMQVSPLDNQQRQGCSSSSPIDDGDAAEGYKPSQFNARTTDEDGNMILWNTNNGALSVFAKAHVAAVKPFLSAKGVPSPLPPLGQYLLKRGFLVTRSTNELRQFQRRFGELHYRTDTLELILLASEDCNFRCKYCYEDFKRGTMLPSVRRNLKELVMRRADSLRRLGINWFGGEPLYGWEAIKDLGPFFYDTARERGWAFSGGVTTNGYLLDDEKASALLAWGVSKFQITVDGPAEHHDTMRPGREGAKTFETIFANMVALKQHPDDFEVRLRINFDRKTAQYLDTLLTELKDAFAGDRRFKLHFHPVHQWGGPNDDALDVCGVSEKQDVRLDFEKKALDYGLPLRTLASTDSFGSSACFAARPYNFIIGADGAVMKCTIVLDKDKINVVGALRDGGQLMLNEERFARWVEPAFERDHKCQSCYLLPSCQGLSCPLIRFESNDSPCDATIKPTLSQSLKIAAKARAAEAREVRVESR
jgi:uncharacterized protein